MKLLRQVIAFILIASMVFTCSAVFAASGYTDSSGHWGEDYIRFWSGNGVVVGYPDSSFRPDNFVTRAETAQVIVNLLRAEAVAIANPFNDISSGDWFYEAVLACVSGGYIEGFDDGTMRPDDSISREQAMVIIARTARIAPAQTSNIIFPDAGEISDWARGSIFGMVNAGIVEGYETGYLRPLQNITRAELVKILRRVFSTYAYIEGNTYQATGEGITLVVAGDVTITGTPSALLVAGGAQRGEILLSGAQVGGIELISDNSIVYVSTDSTVNRDNVTIIGENSNVIYLVDEDDEVPLGAPSPAPAPAPTPAPTLPPGGGGGGGTTTTTYTVGLSIQETTPLSAYARIDSGNISYVASSALIVDVYSQLTAMLITNFRTTYQDSYANAILQEGITAYIAGGATWTSYVDKYITDVSENTSSSVSIRTALRDGYSISGIGTGSWSMIYDVQQGAQVDALGNPVYRQYTVTIVIS